MTKRSLAVIVLIETEDSRLFPEHVNVSTPRQTAQLRKAVLDNLSNVTRIVAVMSEDNARLMCAAHDAGMRAIGELVPYPPKSYVPPTRD
jgi:hypothetical protein